MPEPLRFAPEPPPAHALRDAVVLVCGAAGGLGSAVARAAGAAGATVVLLGRRVPSLEKLYDELERAGGAKPALYPLDLEGATPDDYAQLAATIERELGRLDGILHAAAHFDGLVPLALVAPQDWLRAIHVNLAAAMLLTQACLPLLQKSPDASVVFVLDDRGQTERAHWGGYAVAKAGLYALVRIWGDELEKSPVRIAGLLPGPMRTALRARAWFAENPQDVPPPEAYVPACLYLLGPDGAAVRGAVLDARALAG